MPRPTGGGRAGPHLPGGEGQHVDLAPLGRETACCVEGRGLLRAAGEHAWIAAFEAHDALAPQRQRRSQGVDPFLRRGGVVGVLAHVDQLHREVKKPHVDQPVMQNHLSRLDPPRAAQGDRIGGVAPAATKLTIPLGGANAARRTRRSARSGPRNASLLAA
jgi:hypothetical protein